MRGSDGGAFEMLKEMHRSNASLSHAPYAEEKKEGCTGTVHYFYFTTILLGTNNTYEVLCLVVVILFHVYGNRFS